jgi:hypothetical protein
MDPVLSVSYATIAAFLEAAEGNYRNALYISCHCNYENKSVCGDFLFIPGHDCIPILLPISDAEVFLNTQVDKSECAGIIGSQTFIRLYHKWIELTTSSVKDCPIQQLLHLMNQP